LGVRSPQNDKNTGTSSGEEGWELEGGRKEGRKGRREGGREGRRLNV